MNKLQFTEQLAVRLRIPHSEAERFYEVFVDLIYTTTAADEKVTLSGFGQFSRSHRKARLGVNPRDPKVRITIPELCTPKFKAGAAFKAAMALKN